MTAILLTLLMFEIYKTSAEYFKKLQMFHVQYITTIIAAVKNFNSFA